MAMDVPPVLPLPQRLAVNGAMVHQAAALRCLGGGPVR